MIVVESAILTVQSTTTRHRQHQLKRLSGYPYEAILVAELPLCAKGSGGYQGNADRSLCRNHRNICNSDKGERGAFGAQSADPHPNALDEFSDGGLLPEPGPARRQVLKLELFGVDIMDRAVVCRQETLRPESHRWSGWVDAQFDRIGKILDTLDTNVPSLNSDLGTITVGCALEYLDFRFRDRPWRSKRPQLSAWHEQFALRPSMASTKHPE